MRAKPRQRPLERFVATCTALLITALLGPPGPLGYAAAQGSPQLPATSRGETVYLELQSLARALGVVTSADGDVLTWRGAGGPVTLFAGSPDALTQGAHGPTEVSLSAPVLMGAAAWYVPLDALPLLGVEVPGQTARPAQLALPDGRQLELGYVAAAELGLAPSAAASAAPPPIAGLASWEEVEAPLAGVRFFDGEGVSLLLVDLALVPLAAPELTSAVDRAVDRAQEAGSDHVLLLLVTALAERPWEARLTFEQEGRRLEIAAPYRLLVQEGGATVSPDAPAVAAVLLPPAFSLYRPMRVTWAGTEASVRFRR